ncbi:MAG: DUF5777 family beta-barrel protein [Acidobacteriota bacterium]
MKKMQSLGLLAPVLLIPFTAVLIWGNSTGPLPQFTGGFQEGTCHTCHTDFGLNEGRTRGGTFHISGIPETYTEGTTYPITVLIGQPGQSRWGFELSARHSDSGRQSGQLVPVDDMTQVTEARGIQYIQHTEAGTRSGTSGGPIEFRFNWIAPDPAAGPVYFNAAGNAANASNDPTGDYIYTAGGFSAAQGMIPVTQVDAAPPEPVRRLNVSSRFMHLPAPVDLKQGQTEIHIDHRFIEAVADSRPGRAFGLDAGANINLGVNYAATENLSLGISRARFGEIISLMGTYEIQSDEEAPWKLALHGGVQGLDNFQMQYSPFLQLPASFDYKRLRTYVAPTLVFNSRFDDLVDPEFSVNPQCNHTFSLGLGADLALHPSFSLAGEYVPRLAGFGGLFPDDNPAISGGIKLRTWRHVFTIMLSTSQAFTPGQYGINTGHDKFFIGFNIYRRMR